MSAPLALLITDYHMYFDKFTFKTRVGQKIQNICLPLYESHSHHNSNDSLFSFRTAFHPKSKTLISKERAFDIPTYVLKYTMAGQQWDDGDVEYHRWLSVATLLIYGLQDQLVDLEEEQDMERVRY